MPLLQAIWLAHAERQTPRHQILNTVNFITSLWFLARAIWHDLCHPVRSDDESSHN